MAKPLKGLLKKLAGAHWRSPRIRRLELKSGPSVGKYNTPQLRDVRVQGKVPSKADQDAMRAAFDNGVRDQFLDKVRKEASITDLQAMGLNSQQAKVFKETGELPPGMFQVHHQVPIKLGGDNSFDNLVLIKNDPDHKLITARQNAAWRGLGEGDPYDLSIPSLPAGSLTWPKSGTGAYQP